MRSGVLAAACALALAGCKKEEKPGGGPPGAGAPRGPTAFPVEVETVESRSVEYVVSAVGSVEAFERVLITARVAGVVEEIRFTEGEKVEKGKVLAEIEPARFQLAVRSARAAVEKALAAKADAEAGLERREAVNRSNPGLIRGEELETFRTRARTAAAEASQAQAALEQAELNLRDAYVRAPVSGNIQTRTVQTGQYVQPGTVLSTLVRRDPMLLRFQVAEGDAERLKPGAAARFQVRNDPREHVAKITHVAEAADSASRMIQVTAEIEGAAKEELRPGSFAKVTIPVGAQDAVVIPQTAVRPSEKGFLAYTVEGSAAKERVLTLGMRTPDGRVEVRSGLSPGEKLVVRGAEALRDSAPVKVEGETKEPAVQGRRGESAPPKPPNP